MTQGDNVYYGVFGKSAKHAEATTEVEPTRTALPLDRAEYDVLEIMQDELPAVVIGFRGLRSYCALYTNNYPPGFVNRLVRLGMFALNDPEHPLHDEGIFYEPTSPDDTIPLHPWQGLVIGAFAADTESVFHELPHAWRSDERRLEILADSLVKDFPV